MSEAEPEVMAEYFNKIRRQTELLKTKLNEQPIPLPTVPTDATCGGCRYYVLINESTQTMCCGLEPRFEERSVWHKACRHYQEAAK